MDDDKSTPSVSHSDMIVLKQQLFAKDFTDLIQNCDAEHRVITINFSFA